MNEYKFPIKPNDINTEDLKNAVAELCNRSYEQGKADAKSDIAKECKYILDCGMGKKKSLEHLIKILEKEQSGGVLGDTKLMLDTEERDRQIKLDGAREFVEWLKNNHFSIVEWKSIEQYSVNRNIEKVFQQFLLEIFYS